MISLDKWYEDGQKNKIGTAVNWMLPNWVEKHRKRLSETIKQNNENNQNKR